MGRAWRLSREAEIGFLAFQVELLELSMTGPTGQIGKNNRRELNRFQFGWRSLMGVCSCLLAGNGLRCSGWGRQDWLLCALSRTSHLGMLPPFPTQLSMPGQLLHLWVQKWALLERCMEKGWPRLLPLVHTFLPPEKTFGASLLPSFTHDPGKQGTVGMQVRAALRQQIQKCHISPSASTGTSL